MDGRGRALGLPQCTKLVDMSLVVQNAAGHYAAVAKSAKKVGFS
jgi:hypothetical protein